jgi:hypothetical protein
MSGYLAGVLGVTLGVSALCVAQTASPAATPTTTQPEVSFQFERPGLPVPKFTVVVHEDGTGTYRGEEAPVRGGPGTAVSPGRPINRPITLSAANAQTIFKTARALDYFNIACASKAKNIADTGKKTLNYNGPDGHGSCQYNYSENKSVTQLTEMFRELDPNLTINSIRTIEQQVELSFDQERAVAGLASLFGMVALVLAAIGL